MSDNISDRGLLQPEWDHQTRWTRFWHRPIRAEPLAAARIAFAFCLLCDQLVQYMPFLSYFYGPDGVAPAGVNDGYLSRQWRWPILFFYTDNLAVIYWAFFAWLTSTVFLLVGYKTKIAAFLVWLGAMCFIARNPNLKNGGDDVLQIALFLLLISPCNAALSIDRWLKCKSKRVSCNQEQMPMIDPWPVRLFQIQLCVMYTTTAIAKMRGHTWFDGTSIHNVLNDVTMSRWSYAQLPLPIYVTAPMTWVSLAFEFFFPLLIWNKRIRPFVFLFGVAFHLGIYLMVEVGWFSFYTIAMYSAWIPASFWNRFYRPAIASE